MIFGTNLFGIMRYFFLLHYTIYKFYQRKNDSSPASGSFFVVSAVFSMNLLTLLILFDYFLKVLGDINKWIIVIVILVFVLGLNYFALYKGGSYKIIFNKLENDSLLDLKKVNLIVGIYLFLSFIAVISAAQFVSQNYLIR